MKKHNVWKTNAFLPKKEKEMLELVNDPKKLEGVMKLIQASSDLFDKSKSVKSISILDWENRCIDILPDDMDNRDDFIQQFKNFLNNYEENNATSNE